MENETTNSNLADFGARLTAFCVDAGLMAAGYVVTIKLFFPAHSLFMHPKAQLWTAVWTALFLVYQAFFSCEGRRTAGKALAGIRVVGADGEPLGLAKAAGRSAMYLVSSIFNLGFIWALFDSKGRAWHDMAVGSQVLSDAPPSPARLMGLRVAACACLAVLSGAWYWNNVMSVRLLKAEHDSFTSTGLEEFRMLEKRHFKRHGRYAETLTDLASVSSEPQAFLNETKVLFEDLRITATATGYTIVGRATDPAKTRIAFTGP